MVEEESTTPAVFIIESLMLNDEISGMREGRILQGMLKLAGKPGEYWYIRTKKELRHMLAKFGSSSRRYLHISCHGDDTALHTTYDRVDFREFRELAGSNLGGRRIFFSTCDVVNHKLATAIFPATGCLSLIGPKGSVRFDDAAIMWASFYHLMFKQRQTGMRRKDIQQTLQRISDTFAVPLRYFGRKDGPPHFSDLTIRPRS